MGPYGVTGSPTYAVPITGIENMLIVLPDNTGNQITAQNVRDVVAGLYDNMLGISASVTALGSASVTYTNLNASTVEVGGLALNSTFNNVLLQDLLNSMLYPYTTPTISITASPNVVEYGNTSQTVVLSWYLQSRKNSIISSVVNRPLQANVNLSTPSPNTIVSGVFGSNQIISNTTTVFTFSVSDYNILDLSGSTYSAFATVSWSLSRFWGTLPSSNTLTSVSSSTFSYLDINTLSSDLISGYTQSRLITTNNDYVVFIWPSDSVNLEAFPPKVSINGLGNNDWTKTRDGVVFTNQYGYTASYDVWRFNHIQSTNTFEYIIS